MKKIPLLKKAQGCNWWFRNLVGLKATIDKAMRTMLPDTKDIRLGNNQARATAVLVMLSGLIFTREYAFSCAPDL